MKPPTKQAQSTLSILKYGHPLLRKKVKHVVNFDNLSLFVEQMFITMYAERGIGLAANQVGKSINLLIVDIGSIKENENNHPLVFINSNIIKTEGTITFEEGCLSVPDIRAEIVRPETITIQYQDMKQNVHEKIYSGFESRVIQHELDHLEGKLFVDYLSPSKRILVNKRLLEISENGIPSTGIIL